MRFASLIVELIRARPALIVWLAVLAQAALWLVIGLVFYWSPPGDVALVLATGREYQIGAAGGPPLAFWLADIAFRAAGGHIVGVYLLSLGCQVAAFWALYQLGRAIVGAAHAVLAVLLTLTITAFGAPSLAFGPDILAEPLWMLTLLHSWQVIAQRRRTAWFALSLDAGLLLLTTAAAPLLLLLPIGFALASVRGRRMLLTLDSLFAVLVVAALALPYLVWVVRSGASLPPLPAPGELGARALTAAGQIAMLAGALVGIAVLLTFNIRLFARGAEQAPRLYRAPVDRLGRAYVLTFALAPALIGAAAAALLHWPKLIGGRGLVLGVAGLAVIVVAGDVLPLRRQRQLRALWAGLLAAPAVAVLGAAILNPWISTTSLPTSLPAKEIARFFSENFERRTGRPLQAVAGDPQFAALIALAPSRPHLFLDATPERTPWLSLERFRELGGVVVWQAADTAGLPPDDIAQRFPGLVPELPRAFDRLVSGRLPPLRLGWAIIRPKSGP